MRDGVLDAVAELFAREAGRLRGYLVVLGVSPGFVDDVVQDAFLVAYRKGVDVVDHPNPTAYLYRIARGVAKDRRRAEELAGSQDHDPVPPDWATVFAGHVDLMRALALLPTRQREIAYLRHGADLALDDIGHILGVSKRAVKEHLDQGESRLADLLGNGVEGRESWTPITSPPA